MKNLKITIQELLSNRGMENTSRIRLIRHQDARKIDYLGEKLDIKSLYKKDRKVLLDYQSEQLPGKFKDTDYLVSFIGEEGTLCRFIGVFKLIGKPKPYSENMVWYDMEEVDGFEELKERVIIDWGKSAISWLQWYDKNEKEVVEIRPSLHYEQFTTHDNILIDYQTLKAIFKSKHSDWRNALSCINGIYLIYDKKSQKQYIGSTSGKAGIWQRWSDYAANGHGGNQELIKLLKTDLNYADNYQFSILKVLPHSITQTEAVKIEELFKNKLGTKVSGLNHGINYQIVSEPEI